MAVLEEGLSWQQIGIPPNEAQFLETRKFQVEETCRWFNVPPTMIQVQVGAAASVEQEDLKFVKHSLRPWLVRWEQNTDRKLVLPSQKGKSFSGFVVEGILRGDTAARWESYVKGRQWGVYSANDIRELEDQNPIDDEAGDMYIVPLNMVPIEKLGEEPEEPEEPEGADPTLGGPGDGNIQPDGDAGAGEETGQEQKALKKAQEVRTAASVARRTALRLSHAPLFEEAAQYVVRREDNRVRKGIKKHLGGRDSVTFAQWLSEEYNEQTALLIAERIAPALRAYALQMAALASEELAEPTDTTLEIDALINEIGVALGRNWAASSKNQLLSLLEDTDPDEVEAILAGRVAEWGEKRAKKFASKESRQVGNQMAAAVFLAAGAGLVWRTVGDNCPSCQRLNGRGSGGEPFVGEGEDVEGIVPRRPVLTPPLHRGCDCILVVGG